MVAHRIRPFGWFGIYLAKAFRQGFLRVRLDDQGCFPSVGSVFVDEGMRLPSQECIERITKEIIEESAHASMVVSEPPYYALPHAQYLLTSMQTEVSRLTGAKVPFPISARHDLSLTQEQTEAVQVAMRSPVTIITGGPGTGKTYTAGVFLREAALSSPVPLRVALVAPTGRAVKGLRASIERSSSCELFTMEAATIHSIVSGRTASLPYHIIIVDECSMIDSSLMLRFLQKVPSGVRLVFLGDPDQLPPIDPGQPFFDLLEEGIVPHVALQRCQRTSSLELMELADRVRKGEAVADWMAERDLLTECCTRADWEAAMNLLEHQVAHPWRRLTSVDEASMHLRKTTILTPSRKGFYGSEAINKRCCVQEGGVFQPVVITKNMYALELMNGDLGVQVESSLHIGDRTFPAVLCPFMEQAYAMTVHKSQGSEFDTVYFLIPPGSVVDKRLLYTAITRARKKLVVLAQKADLLPNVLR